MESHRHFKCRASGPRLAPRVPEPYPTNRVDPTPRAWPEVALDSRIQYCRSRRNRQRGLVGAFPGRRSLAVTTVRPTPSLIDEGDGANRDRTRDGHRGASAVHDLQRDERMLTWQVLDLVDPSNDQEAVSLDRVRIDGKLSSAYCWRHPEKTEEYRKALDLSHIHTFRIKSLLTTSCSATAPPVAAAC
jgi:hypothetical protein